MSIAENHRLNKIAVVGRGTAGSLAAASVTSKFAKTQDFELHHIYDSKIPVIGVGEGGWPTLVTQLHELTTIPHENIQMRLNATRKYGVSFEGWGKMNHNFTHFFTPQQVGYSYHLSADNITELLQDASNARYIDAKVLSISNTEEGGARIEFENLQAEDYDLVFDARGFPKEINQEEHISIPFIPTNTAIIRRCPSIINHNGKPYLTPTYTRAVARPHGWVFVIPLTTHTSYGYIFNRDCSDIAEVQSDFDDLLAIDGVKDFEQRSILHFPNFVHRHIYEGPITRIGNAGAFMEPLEATAIVSAQLQIGMVLSMRQNRPVEYWQGDIGAINNFLISSMLGFGLFVGWHYSCGSNYDTEFWRFAKNKVWPQHRLMEYDGDCEKNALKKFKIMLSLLKKPVVEPVELDRNRILPLTSYAQISQGLGCYPMG